MSTIQAIGTHIAQPQAPGASTVPAAGFSPVEPGQMFTQPVEAGTAKVEISKTSRLQSERDTAMALGGRARATDATFERALELVKGMKEQLGNITKQFPPFAADSNERVQFLNSFSGLKAQVKSLTFPSDPPASGELSLVKFPPERMNWDFPDLDPKSASDEEIRLAADKLDQTEYAIIQERRNFQESVATTTGDPTEDGQALMLSQQLKARLAA